MWKFVEFGFKVGGLYYLKTVNFIINHYRANFALIVVGRLTSVSSILGGQPYVRCIRYVDGVVLTVSVPIFVFAVSIVRLFVSLFGEKV